MTTSTSRLASASLFVIGFLVCTTSFADDIADELAGEWTLTIDTPRGTQHPTLVISQDGENYTGIYNSRRGPIAVDSITRDGSNFSFPLIISVPIGDIEVTYRGSISGEDMTGTVQNPRGEVPFTGKRTGN